MYSEFLWPDGVNRMWFAANGFVQNEHGQWVRKQESNNGSNPQEADDSAQTDQTTGPITKSEIME